MAYPASVTVAAPERIAKWRPLVQWLLLIPHCIVFDVLFVIAWMLNVVSWLTIVVTGRMPAGIADFQAMYLRYAIRLYAAWGVLHTQYPPFEYQMTAAEPGGTPVAVSFEPQLAGRNRLTVLFRPLLAVPALLHTLVTGLVAAVFGVLGFFAVLFAGRRPAGVRDWLVSWLGVNLRVNTYLHMLTDEYPPLRLNP